MIYSNKSLAISILISMSLSICFSNRNIQVVKKQTIFSEGTLRYRNPNRKIKMNGDYMAVSVHLSNDEVGHVLIYRKNLENDLWEKYQTLNPDSLNMRSDFGNEIYFKDSLLVIGAKKEDLYLSGGNKKSGIGAVYIYKQDKKSSQWERIEKIQPDDEIESANFGFSIAFHKNDLYIGAPYSEYISEEYNPNLIRGGNIYRYRYNYTLEKYEQIGKLIFPRDNVNFTIGNNMMINGDIMLLSDGFARLTKQGYPSGRMFGRVDVLSYDKQTDNFILNNWYTPEDNYEGQFFGYRSYLEDGIVYIFQNRGIIENLDQSILNSRDDINVYKISGKENLEIIQKIIPTNMGSLEYTYGEMTISGNIMAIGGPTDIMNENGENPIPLAGSVHLYSRAGAEEKWVFNHKIVREQRNNYNSFGYGLDMQGNTLVVSSYYDTIIDQGQVKIGGMLHIYEIDTNTTSVSTQENQPTSPQITISPNPIIDVTTIGIPAVGEVSVYLSDITGARVREIWAGTAEVPTSVMMDATGLVTGEYFVVVKSAEGVISEKIVVER